MDENKNMSRREFIRRMGIGAGSAMAIMAFEPLKIIARERPLNPADIRMTYRVQHGSGEQISLLGFGMMRLPNNQEEVNKLVDYAIEHGVNYFDTAPMYMGGQSEVLMGNALSRHPRSKYFVATKMSNQNQRQWSLEASKQMYEQSMQRLKVDYIDYYLLHSVGGGMDSLKGRFLDNGVLDFLVKERDAGRIKHLGFSYHGDVSDFDYLLDNQAKYHWDFVQIQMNYVDWKHAKEQNRRNVNAEYLYGELAKRNIPAIIMEPLLGGRLTKMPVHIVNNLHQRDSRGSVASWAFRFCGTYPGVLTALSGMTYMEHLQDNLRTFCPLEPLTDDDLAYLEEIAQLYLKYPIVPCNDCKYCMPCPYGLDIPGILLHYNKMVNEGTVPNNLQDPEYQRLRKQYLISYDRAVPSVRQADHCISCGMCRPHCPQNIRIPYELHRIAERVEELRRNVLQ